MGASAAQVRRGRKFDQVLAGAREVFLRDGFEGAAVDDIARVAGVSKATLYSYFPDKRLLFTQVVQNECSLQADYALGVIDRAAGPDVVLRQVAQQLVGFLLSPFALRIFRICLAEADRFPELGRAFYDSGPALARAHLADYLRAACDQGQLEINDIPLAADQFAELCKASIWARAAFGVQSEFSQAEVTRTIDGAISVFLARYSPPGQSMRRS